MCVCVVKEYWIKYRLSPPRLTCWDVDCNHHHIKSKYVQKRNSIYFFQKKKKNFREYVMYSYRFEILQKAKLVVL